MHLPYCRKRCTFCFYKVYTNRNAKPMDRYLEAVFKEIDLYGQRPELRGRKVDTIYFGGGTPTTLNEEQLRELADRLEGQLRYLPDVEWTSESEPGTLSEEKVAALREIGVTRLSMGVQTMDDELLHKNGRSHSSEWVYKAARLGPPERLPGDQPGPDVGHDRRDPRDVGPQPAERSSTWTSSTSRSTAWRSTRTRCCTRRAIPARASAAFRPTRKS